MVGNLGGSEPMFVLKKFSKDHEMNCFRSTGEQKSCQHRLKLHCVSKLFSGSTIIQLALKTGGCLPQATSHYKIKREILG